MRKPHVRTASYLPSDIEGIVAVVRATGIGDHHIHENGIDDMLQELVLVAELDSRIVGFLFCVAGRRNAYIDSVAVLPEYQNEGVGIWLMSELNAHLDGLGVKHLTAVTHPEDGKPVRDMLDRLGYKEMGLVVGSWKTLRSGGLHG